MVDHRAAGRKDGRVIQRTHYLDVVEMGTPLKSFAPLQINARSPNCAQAALIMATVSAGDAIGVLPKPK